MVNYNRQHLVHMSRTIFVTSFLEGPNYFSQRSRWGPIYFRRSNDFDEEQYELSRWIIINLYWTPLGYLFIFQEPYTRGVYLRERILLLFFQQLWKARQKYIRWSKQKRFLSHWIPISTIYVENTCKPILELTIAKVGRSYIIDVIVDYLHECTGCTKK